MDSHEKLHSESSLCHAHSEITTQRSRVNTAGAVRGDGGRIGPMPESEVTGPQVRCVMPFEAAPTEVRLLRRAVGRQLSRWGVPTAADEAELLVTELATNVVKHVGEGSAATLVLERQGERIGLELHDTSPVVPSQAGHCDEECGRGLHLLAGLTVDWGTVLTATGKAVWCEIPTPQGQRACQRVERALEALESYQLARGSAALRGGRRSTGLAESAVELIADLLHWTASWGHDPDDILDRAQMHYEAETEAA
ncbi:ATP-binding protein [Streptomyces olindensis]|uniref:ATP-binding protein n=1 Tax=Streptomyces olindensis TaxID=358823 RepID=UPI00365046E6